MKTSYKTLFTSALALGTLAALTVPAMAGPEILSTLDRLEAKATRSTTLGGSELPNAPSHPALGTPIAGSPIVDDDSVGDGGILNVISDLQYRGTGSNGTLGPSPLPTVTTALSRGQWVASPDPVFSGSERVSEGDNLIDRLPGLHSTSRESRIY